MSKDRFPPKEGVCRICNAMGNTDWHHLISQHRCKTIGKPEWVRNRGNIVELCRSCHDETTASLARKSLSKKPLSKSKKRKCTRCGRTTHTKAKCYAKTHTSGKRLKA